MLCVPVLVSCARPQVLIQWPSHTSKQISPSDKINTVNAVVIGEKQANIAKAIGMSKQTVLSIVNNNEPTIGD